jgi:hypothetical protein
MGTNDAEQLWAAVFGEPLPPVEREAETAMARLASQAGLDAREFERRVMAAAATLKLTPDCISLEEIELYPTLAGLPPARQQHVAACQECTRFLDAIRTPPREVADFVEAALDRPLVDVGSVEPV